MFTCNKDANVVVEILGSVVRTLDNGTGIGNNTLNYVLNQPDGTGADSGSLWGEDADNAAHLAFDDLQLIPKSATQPVFSLPIGGPIFVGEQRSWPLGVALSDLKEPLHLTAGTDRGPIEALIMLSGS